LKAPPSKSINNTEFSDLELGAKKSLSENFLFKHSKASENDEKISLKPKSTDIYDQSLFTKFYILNEKPNGTKLPKRDTIHEEKKNEEEFKMPPPKKRSIWSQIFCCYIENTQNE
jgi:hypothetical protein